MAGFGFSQSGRDSGGFNVTFQNVGLVRDILNEVEGTLKRTANGEMRAGAKKIAQENLIPALRMSAFSSGVPIAPAMAGTMRVKSDRVIAVQVGGVNPKLRGFKRGVGVARQTGRRASGRDATSRSDRTTLAWGSEFGPHPKSAANRYAVPRNNRGYWVQPGVNAPGTLTTVKAAYETLLASIIRKYSRYR